MTDQQIAQILAAAAAAGRAGNRSEELRLIDGALARAPKNPVALNMRGMRALEGRDAAGALHFFARALAADPAEPALHMNKATAHRALGDHDSERASLDAVLAIDQRHFMAWLRKAELLQRTGELPAAAQAWRNVLTMAQTIDPLPPALAPVLEAARGFVTQQNAAFAAFVERELAADRDPLPAGKRRRFDACLDHVLGRREIYANQCSGIHFPFLPADEFFDRDHFPWMATIEAKTGAIRRELEALLQTGRADLRPYVKQDAGTPQNKWSPLNESLDWGAYFLWEYGVKNEAACALCPETAAALESLPRADIPGRAPTAFFSLLRPHTRIPPHTGVTNTRAIIHLPLIVPAGCGFRVGGETREWREGEALAFDDTIEHEAWNDSDTLRAVLIFDVWNPHINAIERAQLRRFFRAAEASGHDPNPRSHG